MAKGSPAIDMTAMVDVAFLLLTFFILTTTKFREDKSVEISPPSSISDVQMPDKELFSIAVDKDGKVFVGFSDIGTRQKALQRIINEKQLQITENGAAFFSSVENTGVPFDQLAGFLELSSEERENFEQPGISAVATDTVDGVLKGNELSEWLRIARFSDPKMRIAITGDAQAPYAVIADVISTHQDMHLNKFNLVTDLEGKPTEEEGEE